MYFLLQSVADVQLHHLGGGKIAFTAQDDSHHAYISISFKNGTSVPKSPK